MKKMIVLILTGLVLVCITNTTWTTCMAAEQAKPITLTFSIPAPETSWVADHFKWWVNEFERRAGDRVKIQKFWMESLTKHKDNLSAVKNRFTDIAWVTNTYHPSDFPFFMMVDGVYNTHEDYVAAILACVDTVENEPNVKAELEKQKVVHLFPWHGGAWQIVTKKCLNSIKDLKGMTIRTVGGIRSEFYKQLGASPVPLSAPESYEALDRGTVEASGDGGIVVMHMFKLQQIVKCVYMINSGTQVGSAALMNIDVFKSLPKDVQEIVPKLRRESAVRLAQSQMEMEAGMRKEWETKYGVTFKYPSEEDQKILVEAGRKANEAFVKQQESRGHQEAGKVLNFYMNALKKYEDERAKKK